MRPTTLKNALLTLGALALLLLAAGGTQAADVVPNEVQMPGSQPGTANVESPNKCDNCHGGYDPAVEPAANWRGSMMSHAGRDPIFWATVAVAEQSFDGAGDLCIRCHSADGWLGGRSTPTDGSALASGDGYGVACDLCHKLTNPDNSEHLGVQVEPFIANDGGTPVEGYYGSGEYVVWGGSDKLGPYDDATARHQAMRSDYHRKSELCGTCHDVSNPVTGDLAHNNGAQVPLAPGTFSGVLGSAVDGKAAFNNPPYAFGIVERTFSEHMSSPLSSMPVADYPTLPADLQAGALAKAYSDAMASNPGSGNYLDGTVRTFTCQTCHMPPVTGQGCNKNPAVRSDLPLHDQTGGNYWMPDAIDYLNTQGLLVLGGDLTDAELAGIPLGKARAKANLERAASLTVNGNVVKVTNLTVHKLISGYPEGRRMWLNVKWYASDGTLLREDGEYGTITADVGGTPTPVRTILDLAGTNTKIYEAHGAMTKEWADQLLALGYPASLPTNFDRVTGAVVYTLGDIAAQDPGTSHETFHFVLNNAVKADNRIPPYQMSYDEAQKRNALPVPATQYGNPGPGGVYDYFDLVTLSPPAAATYATVDLLYQPTSWEYIQFLVLANDGSVARLATTGTNLRDAWLATGMAEPHVMTSATWGTPPACVPDVEVCDDGADNDCDDLVDCDDPDCTDDPACAGGPVCDNDGVCETGEDCTTCLNDCAGNTSGKPSNQFCCGNGTAEGPEGDGSVCDGNF